ncbi:DNA polymerase III subunit delta [bacterium]|nr:DNA polymerase III subunit delta [bacterium]
MKFSVLEREISAKKIKFVYLLSSTESYFLDQAISLISDYLSKGEEESSVEKDTFDSKQASAQEVVNLASTYPFLCPKRLIIVKNFDQTPKSQYPVYQEYFNNPVDFSVVVFTANKMDSRLKITKTAKSLGYLYPFNKLNEYEMPSLIKRVFKSKYKKTIDDEAAVLLTELIGINIDGLINELEKLDLYIDNKKNVTSNDVANMVGYTAVIDSFKMIKALSVKDAKNAMSMLLHLLNLHQEPPERLLGALKWQFRRLYSAKTALENGCSVNQIFSKYNVYPRQQNEFKRQLNIFTSKQLSEIYNYLYITDRKIKSTGLSPDMLLERFFCRILLSE